MKQEILIVEDSQTQMEELKHLLELSGYSVSVASNGLEALSLLTDHRPALIVSDIVMPLMDGFEMCNRIKADPELRTIPVMLFTCLTEAEDVVKALHCGADNYVSKPYDKEYLMVRIEDLIATGSLRKVEGMRVGIKFHFAGTTHIINSDRKQILDVLMSTFESAVVQNRKLIKAQGDCERLNAVLEEQALELVEAKEAAEAATSAKNEFLANVSNEERNVADSIRNGTDMLLAMINDIMDVSKIESGALKLLAAPFDLRDCLEGTLELLAARAREKGVGLSCTMDSSTPLAIIGDAARLRRILASLISNAVKFTDEGEVTVSVSATRHSVDLLRFELLFAVKDTGIGIPKNRMDRLFTSLSPPALSVSPQYGGTGSGLAIGKRLCELMGGKMWAESEVGKGATFFFAFEAAAAPGQAQNNFDVSAQVEPQGVEAVA